MQWALVDKARVLIAQFPDCFRHALRLKPIRDLVQPIPVNGNIAAINEIRNKLRKLTVAMSKTMPFEMRETLRVVAKKGTRVR